MFLSPLRYCSHIGYNIKHKNTQSLTQFAFGRRSYSNKDDEEKALNRSGSKWCQERPQTEGKTLEPWPKGDPPPPAWRWQCPQDPQPVNYDPYRIKVPDIQVPPLPESTPKRIKELPQDCQPYRNPVYNFENAECQFKDMFHNSPVVHPDYWKEKSEAPKKILVREVLPKLGYHGRKRYKFAFHEPWRPLDRLTLLEQAEKDELDNAIPALSKMAALWVGSRKPTHLTGFFLKIFQPMIEVMPPTKGPCSMKLIPDRPPCPPPPAPPFPWIYVWATAAFLSAIGIFYRLYRYKEAMDLLGDKPIWRPRKKRKRPYHDVDLPPCVQYLIIGTGAAGWAAYRSIMQHDKTAKVFFVTKEDCLPYRRPPMSKWMWWNTEPPEMMKLQYLKENRRYTMYNSECRKFLDPVAFYRKETGPAVSIASGWCVLRVDADDHVAWVKTMCGEQPIYYERCLIAPGAKPKQIEAFKHQPSRVRKKVTTFRTIRDLEIAFRKVREAKHVTIIGGGLLGCELAWHLGKMQKEVPAEDGDEVREPIEFVHMYKDKGVLSNIVPEYLGEWAAEKIKCENVTLMPKTLVYDAFTTPDDRLELTLSNGSSLVTDYVIVAVGTEPREELAEPSFLEVDKINGGFKVNTELEARTHLYVAGDAASFYSMWKDTRQRFEHYDNAEEQGFTAGANMAGYWFPCNMEPHYDLVLGKTLQIYVIGEVGACMPTIALFKNCKEDPNMTTDQKISEGLVTGEELPCYKQPDDYKNRYKRGLLFYLRDDTVVGMMFWNIPPIEDQIQVCTELLRAKPSYEDINLLAELVGFQDARCIYSPPEESIIPGPCIKNWRVF